MDFPPEDIIFDCNVVGIGLHESKTNAADFIAAVAEIRRTCPSVSVSGGVSNFSVLFRWSPKDLRDAMHSVFLYYAVPKGLNMAIVECGKVPRYSDIEQETRQYCEEVILNGPRDGKHAERFLAAAAAETGSVVPYQPFRQPPKIFVSREMHRLIVFSSLSVMLGQGGNPFHPGASACLDGIAQWTRWQINTLRGTTMQWGPVGDIGLRRAAYGSRDVFALANLGQALINPDDAYFITKIFIGGQAQMSYSMVDHEPKAEYYRDD